MKKTIFLITFLMGLNHVSWAQSVDTSKIALISRNANDSITLRWLTDNFDVLKMGIASGYTISRAEQNNGVWSRFNTVATVKSWSKQRWNAYLNGIKDTSSTAYRYGKAAYDILFDGDAYLPTDLSDIEAIKNAKAMRDLSFLFATLASCNDPVAAEGMALRWVDKQVQTGKKYRYRIGLVSNTGSKPVKGVTIDAQAAPHVSKTKAAIKAIENESNIVLNWKVADEPLISYSLERSDDNGKTFRRLNQADHEFSAIFETFSRNDTASVASTQSVFYDTLSLNTLTRKVFYKAVALDFHYNESDPSKLINVTRPDTIPPVAPVLNEIQVSETALTLNMTPSSSEDVKAMKVLRKKKTDNDWAVYQTLKPTETTFKDERVEPEVAYEYAVQAVDSSDLASPLSFVMSGRTYDSGARETVEGFDARYDKDSKEVILTWAYKPKMERNEKVSFLIYRALGDKDLERYKTVIADEQFFFKDTDFPSKGVYNYSVKVITSKGAESELCPKMTTFIE